jgi:hypothetical protein
MDGRYAVKVSARWRDESGRVLSEQNSAKGLPFDVQPGDTVGLLLDLTAPTKPGEFSLELDVMQEGVGWFADHGSEPSISKVQVTPNR